MNTLILATQTGPSISINGGKGLSTPVEIMLLLTLLTVLPGALFMVTGFTRILIVLGFVRNALGTPTSPPNQVLVGIAIFLTLFVMAPTFKVDQRRSRSSPTCTSRSRCRPAIDRGQEPLRDVHVQADARLRPRALRQHGAPPRPKTRADVPTYVLIPAFIISELKTAFQIGFLIYLPFLIIDMVVASTLMSMGMMMLPPVLISLPFKILLFVLVDGWHLVIQGLVQSFHT